MHSIAAAMANRIGHRGPDGMSMTMLPAATIERWAGPLARRAGIAHLGDELHKLGNRLRHVRDIDRLYLSLVTERPDAKTIVAEGEVPDNLLGQRDAWPPLAHPVARMMALDAMTYLLGDILVKVNRVSMAVSLETRALFLDREVIELAWRLPMSMKIREGKVRWILRQLLDRHVPRALIERPKMGFEIPLDQWLRGPLREWAGDLLAEDRLRREGYPRPETINRTWHAQQRGEGSYGYRLWLVLIFQA